MWTVRSICNIFVQKYWDWQSGVQVVMGQPSSSPMPSNDKHNNLGSAQQLITSHYNILPSHSISREDFWEKYESWFSREDFWENMNHDFARKTLTQNWSERSFSGTIANSGLKWGGEFRRNISSLCTMNNWPGPMGEWSAHRCCCHRLHWKFRSQPDPAVALRTPQKTRGCLWGLGRPRVFGFSFFFWRGEGRGYWLTCIFPVRLNWT